MSKDGHVSVLVVGAGPVGLAMASMLRRHNLSVRIVDKADGITSYSKAVGVHASTLESMQALGVSDLMVSDGCPLRNFKISKSNGRELMSVSFDQIPSRYQFVLGLPQSRTERRLLDSLNLQGVDVEWGGGLAEIISTGSRGSQSQPAVVKLVDREGKEEIVSCNWLIGADGSRSKVRDEIGVEFSGGDYGNAFILGDVRMEGVERFGHVQFYLSGNGYLLIVPMPGGLYRIIAQTNKRFSDFQHGGRPEATLDELQAVVDTNGPGGLRLHSPEWLTSAPFYFRSTSTPVVDRVVLAGDSFHLFSPLGAQGLNTGFQDVFNLAWKISYVEKGWVSDEIINTYQEERVLQSDRISKVTSNVTRYITEKRFFKRFFRDLLTRLCSRGERVQLELPRLISGMVQSYGEKVFLSGGSASPLIGSGTRLKPAMVADGGGVFSLGRLIHGLRFSVVLFSRSFNDEDILFLEGLSCKSSVLEGDCLQVLAISPDGKSIGEVSVPGVIPLHDVYGEVQKNFGSINKCMLLVRPDGYIAFSSDGWDWDMVSGYFLKRGFLFGV